MRRGGEQQADAVDEAAGLRALQHHGTGARGEPFGERGLELEGHRGREDVDRGADRVEREVEDAAADAPRAPRRHLFAARKRASDSTVRSPGSSTLAIHSGRKTGRPSNFSRSIVSSTTLSESSPRSARIEACGVIRLRSFFGTNTWRAWRTSGNSSGSCLRERTTRTSPRGPDAHRSVGGGAAHG